MRIERFECVGRRGAAPGPGVFGKVQMGGLE